MSKLAIFLVIVLAAFFVCSAAIRGGSNSSSSRQQAWEDAPEIIPRSVLFGEPERTDVLISPDGKWISYLLAEKGIFNVQIAPLDNISNVSGISGIISRAKQATAETAISIKGYTWAYTSRHIIYLRDFFGDENWHIYATDIITGETMDLTPFKGISATLEARSSRYPEEIIVGLNVRDPECHDLYRINIITGKMHLVLKNRDRFARFVIDDDLRVRLAASVNSSGGVCYLMPDECESGSFNQRSYNQCSWKPFLNISYQDSATTSPIGFDRSGRTLYLSDSRGRDKGRVTSIDMATGRARVLAEDAQADPGRILVHPRDLTVQAVSFNYYRHNWTILDKSIQPDFDRLRNEDEGDISVSSRSLDDSRWIVVFRSDRSPARYYLYDREKGLANFLFSADRRLEGLSLSRINYTTIKSRDGLDLILYYTLPTWSDRDSNGIPDEPLPAVLAVHGGPWERDVWGYDPLIQLLANRGYAVLQVNYRGSTGIGKSFTNAGDREWGRRMQDDLLDAVLWAAEKGIADPESLAIMGSSYGGYATLAAMAFTPEVFACGVDICGPSNLTSFLLAVPEYWKATMDIRLKRIGDCRTKEGRKLLEERSPLTYVHQIQNPILICQGGNDPRVDRNESDQIVSALQEKNIPVVYAFYPDEGHGLIMPGNGMSFYALMESFLSANLGGRYEPIGSDLDRSSLKIPVGADRVPGLEEAMALALAHAYISL